MVRSVPLASVLPREASTQAAVITAVVVVVLVAHRVVVVVVVVAVDHVFVCRVGGGREESMVFLAAGLSEQRPTDHRSGICN